MAKKLTIEKIVDDYRCVWTNHGRTQAYVDVFFENETAPISELEYPKFGKPLETIADLFTDEAVSQAKRAIADR